jgi:hypothetical protein
MTPTENGWKDNDGLLKPLLFEGTVLQSYLFKEGEVKDNNNNNDFVGEVKDNNNNNFVDELDIRDALYDSDDTIVLDGSDIVLSDSDDEAWSEDSDADNEC